MLYNKATRSYSLTYTINVWQLPLSNHHRILKFKLIIKYQPFNKFYHLVKFFLTTVCWDYLQLIVVIVLSCYVVSTTETEMKSVTAML